MGGNVVEEEEEQEKDSQKASDETIIKVTPSKDSETKEETAKEKVKETKNDEKKVEKKVEKKSQDTPKASAKDTPDSVTPEVASTLGKLGLEHPLKKEKKEKPTIMRSPSEYFPLIRRGMLGESTDDKLQEEEELAVGWKVDFANRKEREESLRDEVRRFMIR